VARVRRWKTGYTILLGDGSRAVRQWDGLRVAESAGQADCPMCGIASARSARPNTREEENVAASVSRDPGCASSGHENAAVLLKS